MQAFAFPSTPLALGPAPGENRWVAPDEAELHSRALAGDHGAFAALVKPHLALLYRIAARATGDGALAEDAVQEALTIASRDLARYRPGTSLRAFLASIAVKRAKTLSRSERRRRAREERAAEPEDAPSPSQNLAAERLAERIREALASMPRKRREAAMLRLDGGLSYDEIAQAVGSTAASSRVLVHLALADLRERLGLDAEGDSR